MLTKLHENISCKLFEQFTENNNQLVLLNGDSGTGKTSIAIDLANKLNEDWSIFAFEGLDPMVSPYYTLQMNSSDCQKISPYNTNVTFQLKLPFAAVSASLSDKKFNAVFSEHEQMIIQILSKTSSLKNNILFILDDYDKWDQPSKELIHKIYKNKSIDNKNINILIINETNEKLLIKPHEIFTITEFTEDFLKEILTIWGYSHVDNIKEAQSCSNNNLHLLRMFCSSLNGTSYNMESIFEILDSRINKLDEKEITAINEIKNLSIIDGYFNLDDAQALCEHNKLTLSDFLETGEKYEFIRKPSKYAFSSKFIKTYFVDKLKSKVHILNSKFSAYLRIKRSEDYLLRVKHLVFSNEPKNFIEAYFLLIIERSRCTNIQSDFYIFDKYFSIIYSCYEQIKSYEMNRKFYYSAMENLSLNQFNECLQNLESIDLFLTPTVFKIEVIRQKLAITLLIAQDYDEIEMLSSLLYEQIIEKDFDEQEQRLLSAILLLSVYKDRIYDEEKFKNIQRLIDETLHVTDSLFFLNIKHQMYRRSALYTSPLIAVRSCDLSVQYFNKSGHIIEEYRALCNLSGNAIVCVNCIVASDSIYKLKAIINENTNILFPSLYKVHNNEILANFIQSCETSITMKNPNQEEVLNAGQIAITQLLNLSNMHENETSYVIDFNLVSFYLLTNDFVNSKILIDKLNNLIRPEDKFYNYYLVNMELAYNYFIENKELALELLEKIKLMDMPLIFNFKKISEYRNVLLYDIINSKNLSPYEFNYFYLKSQKRIDNSWYFYGRGLLLSDLQFLST